MKIQFLGGTLYFYFQRSFPYSIFSIAFVDNALDLKDSPHHINMDSDSFVAFLRMEADLSEEKARRLRAQADALATQHGITMEMESSYGE